MEEDQEISLGEKRVRTNFNVSGRHSVDNFKVHAAQFINKIDALEAKLDGDEFKNREFLRLKALAMTAAEEAAMWAVKAATI